MIDQVWVIQQWSGVLLENYSSSVHIEHIERLNKLCLMSGKGGSTVRNSAAELGQDGKKEQASNPRTPLNLGCPHLG